MVVKLVLQHRSGASRSNRVLLLCNGDHLPKVVHVPCVVAEEVAGVGRHGDDLDLGERGPHLHAGRERDTPRRQGRGVHPPHHACPPQVRGHQHGNRVRRQPLAHGQGQRGRGQVRKEVVRHDAQGTKGGTGLAVRLQHRSHLSLVVPLRDHAEGEADLVNEARRVVVRVTLHHAEDPVFLRKEDSLEPVLGENRPHPPQQLERLIACGRARNRRVRHDELDRLLVRARRPGSVHVLPHHPHPAPATQLREQLLQVAAKVVDLLKRHLVGGAETLQLLDAVVQRLPEQPGHVLRLQHLLSLVVDVEVRDAVALLLLALLRLLRALGIVVLLRPRRDLVERDLLRLRDGVGRTRDEDTLAAAVEAVDAVLVGVVHLEACSRLLGHLADVLALRADEPGEEHLWALHDARHLLALAVLQLLLQLHLHLLHGTHAVLLLDLLDRPARGLLLLRRPRDEDLYQLVPGDPLPGDVDGGPRGALQVLHVLAVLADGNARNERPHVLQKGAADAVLVGRVLALDVGSSGVEDGRLVVVCGAEDSDDGVVPIHADPHTVLELKARDPVPAPADELARKHVVHLDEPLLRAFARAVVITVPAAASCCAVAAAVVIAPAAVRPVPHLAVASPRVVPPGGATVVRTSLLHPCSRHGWLGVYAMKYRYCSF
eukprot:Rhum_TRINITY_DN16706_c0_g1::Rhum_TRINITY_DN16706_c0_g1_i1::g.164146::m.164146